MASIYGWGFCASVAERIIRTSEGANSTISTPTVTQ